MNRSFPFFFAASILWAVIVAFITASMLIGCSQGNGCRPNDVDRANLECWANDPRVADYFAE